MRIDLTHAALAAAQAEARPGAVRADQARHKAPIEVAESPAPAPEPPRLTPPAPQVLTVSIDQSRNTIYRFTDEKTGELVRQVPPEEVLRIMRNIEQLLQKAEQKLKVTL